MASQAIGPFTHPDSLQDETWPNALFETISVDSNRKRPSEQEAIASYSVFATQAKRNAGKRPRYENTIPFSYAPNGGSIYTQALTALKAQYPGLVDA